MPEPVPPVDASQWLRADGEWWVLLVTDGLTVEYPPELYRNREHAGSECERWAQILSAQWGEPVERPFEGRWQIGERWIRLVHSFLSEQGPAIWVGTYWGRDGSPEPEAALFSDSAEATAWAREPPAGGDPIDTHETPWSVTARFRVRGGEEEAEVHRSKVIADLTVHETPPEHAVLWGFEVSEGLIPQGPELFKTEEARDQALRSLLEAEMTDEDWRNLVSATAESNHVDSELPPGWRETWSDIRALDWLLGFGFIGNGDNYEIRSFETWIQ